MESTSVESKLRAALALDVHYTERLRPAPAEGANAAVLAVFGQNRMGDLSILVIRRAESLHAGDAHSGQMAFPGGRADAEEVARKAFDETALRETEEEVGILHTDLKLLGRLPSITTFTGFWVEPFVALLTRPFEDLVLELDSQEIAEAIWVPWSQLMDPTTYKREWLEKGGLRFATHVFYVQEYRIWGATGAMIKNLIDRWQQVR